MVAKSAIEWTEQTWNPTTGCTKVSPGCKNCYAEIMARRLKAMGLKGYENGFSLTLQPDRLKEPLSRKKPTVYFVNSMSDLFHEDIPEAYIRQVFDVIKNVPQHTFQIFFKQWGGWGADGKKRSKKANGRLLFGRTWDNMPDALRPSYAPC